MPEGRIDAMIGALKHRGPDDRGVMVEDGCALGHARLSIIDLSAAGHQPMSNEDGSLWLVFNGEIYNFEELRAELVAKGHVFRSNTDSEVILHQYEEDGDACVTRFNGMFAFALWDRRRNRMVLARDRAGEKPLFFAQGSDHILFGSEIKAVLASGLVSPDFDPQAIQTCMIYNAMAAPMTVFKAVRQLLPAHVMVVDESGVRSTPYWRLLDQIGRDRGAMSDDDWLAGFGAHLERSVKMRMRSDAPYGAFLSGGLDSTAIVKVMAETLSDKVRTYAFGFQEHAFDEVGPATEVAGIFGTQHRNIYARMDNLPDLVELAVRHGEEYTPNPCFIPVHLLCKEASTEVKMVLSGDGADELLAGYETYQATAAAAAWRRLPLALRRLVAAGVRRLPPSEGKVPLETKLKRFVYGANLPGREPHALWRHIFTPEGMRDCLMAEYAQGGDPSALYKERLAEAGDLPLISGLLYGDFSYYLPNDALVKTDRMGMANGLEIRSPFLDHHLVEYCFGMPDRLKLRGLRTKKFILKRYLAGTIPDHLIRRKKAGFNVPVDAWIRGPLRAMVNDVLSSVRLKGDGVFCPQTVQAMMREHMAGHANRGLELWNILCLTLLRTAVPDFIGASGAAASALSGQPRNR